MSEIYQKYFPLLLEEIQTEQHHFLITQLLKIKYTVYLTYKVHFVSYTFYIKDYLQ